MGEPMKLTGKRVLHNALVPLQGRLCSGSWVLTRLAPPCSAGAPWLTELGRLPTLLRCWRRSDAFTTPSRFGFRDRRTQRCDSKLRFKPYPTIPYTIYPTIPYIIHTIHYTVWSPKLQDTPEGTQERCSHRCNGMTDVCCTAGGPTLLQAPRTSAHLG